MITSSVRGSTTFYTVQLVSRREQLEITRCAILSLCECVYMQSYIYSLSLLLHLLTVLPILMYRLQIVFSRAGINMVALD